MEIKTLFGLPAHPLLVHLPIVLLPLVGIGAVAVALSTRLRQRFGVLVVALAAVALLGTFLATNSGESLVDSVPKSSALDRHVELAGTMRPLAFVLLLAVGAVVLLDLQRRQGRAIHRALVVGAAAVAIIAAIGANAWLMAVGHNGAEATWRKVHVAGSDDGVRAAGDGR